MKLTTTDFKQKRFGEVVAFARSTSPVTLTTRNQEDLILIKKSDLDKITDKHKQLEIQHSIEAKVPRHVKDNHDRLTEQVKELKDMLETIKLSESLTGDDAWSEEITELLTRIGEDER